MPEMAPANLPNNPTRTGDHVPAPLFHPDFGQAHVQMWPRPADDEAATEQTIRRMIAYAVEDAPQLAGLAGRLVGSTPSETLNRLFWWVKRNVRYRTDEEIARAGQLADPESAEVLIRPADLVRMPQPAGDCDDHAMFTAALLRAAGIPSCYVTIAADHAAPEQYSHVYTVALPAPGVAVPMDTAFGSAPGWSAPPVGKARPWQIGEHMPLPTLRGADDTNITLPDFFGLYNSTPDPVSTSHGASLAEQLALIAANTASTVVKTQYGQPAAGTYISGPQGTYYRQQEGAGVLSLPSTANAAGLGTILGIALIGVIGVAALKALRG